MDTLTDLHLGTGVVTNIDRNVDNIKKLPIYPIIRDIKQINCTPYKTFFKW